jgi:hypothetical protein
MIPSYIAFRVIDIVRGSAYLSAQECQYKKGCRPLAMTFSTY